MVVRVTLLVKRKVSPTPAQRPNSGGNVSCLLAGAVAALLEAMGSHMQEKEAREGAQREEAAVGQLALKLSYVQYAAVLKLTCYRKEAAFLVAWAKELWTAAAVQSTKAMAP